MLRFEDGQETQVDLRARSVAMFYAEVMTALQTFGVTVHIGEIVGATPFPKNQAAREFDGAAARTYWRGLLQVQRVFQRFRTRFVGKCSPVHLF